MQEILEKYTYTHAFFLVGDINASLQSRGSNDQDRKRLIFCSPNGLLAMQHGIPTFNHVNGNDVAETDYILLNEKARPLVKTVRVENFTDFNTSDHVPV